jgi:hypothetical protein
MILRFVSPPSSHLSAHTIAGNFAVPFVRVHDLSARTRCRQSNFHVPMKCRPALSARRSSATLSERDLTSPRPFTGTLPPRRSSGRYADSSSDPCASSDPTP